MKLSFYKLILIMLGISSITFADPCSHWQSDCAPKKCMEKAYNYPARVDTCGTLDIFVSGSFIYYKAKEKSLLLGTNETSDNVHSFKDIDYKYKPGFKVLAGLSFNPDDWQLSLEYTWFHTKYHGSATAPEGGTIIPWWNGQSVTSTYAKSTWKIGLDQLDVKIARPFYNGRMLMLTPHIGLRQAWLDQILDTTYTISNMEIPTHGTIDSYLLGPRAGIDSNWCLGGGFRFYGNTALGLYYQQVSTHIKEYRNGQPTSIYEESKHKLNQLTPNLEFNLGLGWGMYFCKNRYHLDISGGYDMQILWEQNFMDSLYYSDPADLGSLYLHGFVAKAIFDF